MWKGADHVAGRTNGRGRSPRWVGGCVTLRIRTELKAILVGSRGSAGVSGWIWTRALPLYIGWWVFVFPLSRSRSGRRYEFRVGIL